MFLPHVWRIFFTVYSFISKWFYLAIETSTSAIWSLDGAGTLRLIHLDRIGIISLWIFLHTKIILQWDIYFSIVLLKDPWASLLSLSASLMIKILNYFPDFCPPIAFEEAIYFTTFWTMNRSSLSLSAGVISMWWWLLKIVYSIVLVVPYGLRVRYSSASCKELTP